MNFILQENGGAVAILGGGDEDEMGGDFDDQDMGSGDDIHRVPSGDEGGVEEEDVRPGKHGKRKLGETLSRNEARSTDASPAIKKPKRELTLKEEEDLALRLLGH